MRLRPLNLSTVNNLLLVHNYRDPLTCKSRLIPQHNIAWRLLLLHVIPALFTLKKSTLCGGFRIQVTGLTSYTIPWISEDLTSSRHSAPDPSHLDTAASQWDITVLSGQGTMGYPELELLSEPPVWAGISNISFSS